MADRKTKNVSLPPEQDQFIRTMVESGRFRTASEVVREGLRLLEEAEHRRLLEKWICDSLTPEEDARLPTELRDRARARIARLIQEGIRSGEQYGWRDGPQAMSRVAEKLEERFRRDA